METAAATAQTSHQQQLSEDIESSGFRRDAKETLLDLNSSNADILSFIEKAYGENGSQADQMYLQELLNIRTRMITSFTNFMKMMFDASMRVINNIRA
ncbi:MAG: hypothetical protein KDD66_03830 [Bdellovibrionales bacterium]|nr:hypothetical protein [Bdellovibrionales bacterium]